MTQQPPIPPDDEPKYGVRLPPDQQLPQQPGAWGSDQGTGATGPGAGSNPYGQAPSDQPGTGLPSYGQQAPYGGQSPYGGPAPTFSDPYAGGYGRPANNSKNNLGVWALVCGIGGLLCNPAFLAGIVLGILGLKAVNEGTATNRGMVLTGLVISCVGVVLWILALVYLQSIGFFDQLSTIG